MRPVLLVAILLVVPSARAQTPASAESCACATPLLAGFSHELRDGRHVTTTDVVVPAPVDEVAATLADVGGYPSWLFRGEDGTPTLHGLAWDRATGAFSVLVGAGGKGMPLAGTLHVATSTQGTSVRAQGSDADVKEWSFELQAAADPACPARSVITLRMDLLFSMKARLFGGSAKSMPLLLALAARDDLAARFVGTPERMSCAGLERVATTASGRPSIALDGKAATEVLSCRPHAIGVGAERAQAFGRQLEKFQSGKGGDVGDLLDAAAAAISGRHPILSWRLALKGSDGPTVVGKAPASVHASASVQPEEKGFSLAFGAGASK